MSNPRGRPRGDGGRHGGVSRGDGGNRGGGGYGGGGHQSGPVKTAASETELKILIEKGEIPLIRKSDQFVSRPGYVTVDRYISLITNHFGITLPKKSYVWMYDVDIKETTKRGSGPGRPEKVSKPKAKLAYDALLAADSRLPHDQRIFYNVQARKPIIEIYDGYKILYTSQPLEENIKRSVVVHETAEGWIPATDDNKLTFDVTITKTQSDPLNLAELNDDIPNLRKQPLIAALNAIFKRGPCVGKLAIGQNRLFPIYKIVDNGTNSLGGGAIAVDGHFQSVRPSGDGYALVVNQATAAFYPNTDNLLRFMEYYVKGDKRAVLHNLIHNNEGLEGALSNMTLQTTHRGWTHQHKNFVRICPNKLGDEYIDVEIEPGRTEIVPLIKYYNDKYKKWFDLKGIKLEDDSDLPCLEYRTGNGRTNKIPIPLLRLKPNQPVPGVLRGDQQRKMIEKTAISPVDRFKNNGTKVKAIKQESKGILEHFNLELSVEPKKAPGKVLPAPTLKYGNNQVIKPNEGKWDMRNKKFCKGVSLKDWIVFGRGDDLKAFVNRMVESAKKVGMVANPPLKVVDWVYNGPQSVEKMFKDAKPIFDSVKSPTGLPKLILIYAEKNDIMYHQIKAHGETRVNNVGYGYCTQVIVEENVPNMMGKGIHQYVANVLLKVNGKLTGFNHVIDTTSLPPFLKKENHTMIIGADVTHAHHNQGDSSRSVPFSVAALCASYEHDYFKYYTAANVQEKPIGNKRDQKSQEMITSIDVLFIAAVKNYAAHNGGKKPEHIIYYRDGVSEGQFDAVLREEVTPICGSFTTMDANYKPKITVVIVAKRGQTRIRPEFPADGGRSGNVPAGTLVDTIITHPEDFDFWLNSHEGIQGTSKPAHYTVIRDDYNFNASELAQLTNYLCYTFVRCTRAISVPSPVRYAHLAADRARSHLNAKPFPPMDLPKIANNDTGDERAAKEQKIDEAIRERITLMNRAISVAPHLRTTFYYG